MSVLFNVLNGLGRALESHIVVLYLGCYYPENYYMMEGKSTDLEDEGLCLISTLPPINHLLVE